MDAWNDTHDQGLYSAMLRGIAAFRDGAVTLKQLIDTLRSSRGQLHAVDAKWADEFEGRVAELEFIFNDCVERQSPLVKDEFDLILASVGEIESLLSRNRTWSDQQIDVVRQVVWERRPELLDAVDAAFESGFSPKTADEIRNMLREEIYEKGTTDGTINQWGQICEDLITRITPASP